LPKTLEAPSDKEFRRFLEGGGFKIRWRNKGFAENLAWGIVYDGCAGASFQTASHAGLIAESMVGKYDVFAGYRMRNAWETSVSSMDVASPLATQGFVDSLEERAKGSLFWKMFQLAFAMDCLDAFAIPEFESCGVRRTIDVFLSHPLLAGKSVEWLARMTEVALGEADGDAAFLSDFVKVIPLRGVMCATTEEGPLVVEAVLARLSETESLRSSDVGALGVLLSDEDVRKEIAQKRGETALRSLDAFAFDGADRCIP